MMMLGLINDDIDDDGFNAFNDNDDDDDDGVDDNNDDDDDGVAPPLRSL